jgi:predicted P-loop ATPase
VEVTIASGLEAGLKKPHGDLKDKSSSRSHFRSNGRAPGSEPDGDAVQWPDLGKGGAPVASCANARRAIEALGIKCSYDVFHDRKMVSGHAIEQWAGELSDHACQMLRVIIKEKFGFDPGREHTHDGAVQLCLRRQFDPVCDYLNSLQWDKRKRLDTWMATYLGAENTELTRAIGRLALVAAVRRARQPGYKFDQIIVLEGPEGTGKSTAIEILAGKENFSDQTILGLEDRQQQEAMRGVWLFEIADLAGMSKADVDKTKSFASRVADRARPAYGRARVELPRRCVFFATTNNDTYLKSQTGNRRFWPVKTGRINLEALRRDRDMLWAEAARIEATGVPLELPETLWAAATIEQERRRDHDPWDEILANVKGIICDTPDGTDREERISTAELLKLHLNLPADKITDSAAKRLSFCMGRLGWEKPPDPIYIPGKGTVRGYRRKLARSRKGRDL